MHTFFADSIFHQGKIFVQKFGLDNDAEKRMVRHCVEFPADKDLPETDKCRDLPGKMLFEKNLKKGVDFDRQTRYNVCLYGKLEEGGALNGKYQVL